ncbi:MAG: radical SAM protein [Desulfosporosinus sp.]
MRIIFFIAPPASPDHPLLGVASLATMVRDAGHDVIVFDLNATLYHEGFKEKSYWQKEKFDYWSAPRFINDIKPEIIKMIEGFEAQYDHKPDVICFHVNDTSKALAGFCAQQFGKIYQNARLVAGGPAFFSIDGENASQEPYDIIVSGEGEKALASWLENGCPSGVKVISETKLDSLDFLVKPDYSLFTLSLYARPNVFPFETSRGCNNHCGFCNDVLMWGPLRNKSPERLIAEFEILKNNWGNIHISFCDSLLNPSPCNFRILLQILKDYDFTWDGMIQVEGVDKDIADLMFQSGCKDVFMGVESFSDNYLSKINKAKRTTNVTAAIRVLAKAGIKPSIGLIIAGNPFQNRSEFDYDMDHIRNLPQCLKSVAVNPLCIPKGTWLYKHRSKFSLQKLDDINGWKFWHGPNGFEDVKNRFLWCKEAAETLKEIGLSDSANYIDAVQYAETAITEAQELAEVVIRGDEWK